jgi:hypothetical protein
MVLSINEEKVNEELEKTPPRYVVSPFNWEPQKVPHQQLTTDVCTAVTEIPPDVARARADLLSLRQQMIEAGKKPLTPDELDREIDEIRGR